MAILIYGGREETVRKQLCCDHDWHGPCLGATIRSRYFKCRKCFALDVDLPSISESEIDRSFRPCAESIHELPESS